MESKLAKVVKECEEEFDLSSPTRMLEKDGCKKVSYNSSELGLISGPFCRIKSEKYCTHNERTNVLFYCKPFDHTIITEFSEMLDFIYGNFKKVKIHVDKWVIDEMREAKFPEDKLPQEFVNSGPQVRRAIDLIVCLGGDGTILWASK